MAYTKRLDGRKIDELRPMEAKAGVIPNADGSAIFKAGKTTAYAAVYGPREMYPRFLQNPKIGVLRCHYGMMPFSGSGERIRPGSSRRAQEIAMVMTKALAPVVDLSAFPNAVVDVYVDLPQTDAGTRCAAISAAAIALADAGIPMRDLVCAVGVGKAGGEIILDLNKTEEDAPDAVDIPLAIMPREEEITLLQMDGLLTKEEWSKSIKLGIEGCKQLYEMQKEALRKKYVQAETPKDKKEVKVK